jgi:hypothetical protein
MKDKAKVTKAKMEAAKIAQAISAYESTYSRPPITVATAQLVASANGDFTFGSSSTGVDIAYSPDVPQNAANVRLNAEVIAIIMDLVKFGNGTETVNTNHVKNTQQQKFLTAEIQSDTISPGVGADGVFRDPWGNPYIITLDLNGDEKTRDAFYSSAAVSDDGFGTGNGLNGLVKTTVGGTSYYEFHGSVMVWSAGPDKKVNANTRANQGDNKDNVLSWK